MIELNLLPDIKLEYIKAQRTRRLVLSISLLASAVAITLLVLLLGVNGLQKKHLSDLNNDIKNDSSTLQREPNINQILTIQNQLESFSALHSAKPAVTRLFSYLDQVTPAAVDINNFTTDFTQNTAIITGDADALSSVNQYVDTLKFTTYTSSQTNQSAKAFSNVVLSAFSLSTGANTTTSTQNTKPATFTINLSYDKNIFDITQNINLSVPNLVTTRSASSNPTDLFTVAPNQNNSANGGAH
jgi:hypothetical protein